MKIICVDDEELVLKLTISACERLTQRPEVLGFGRAREALAYLKEHETDLVLLDIAMPGMDGLELAARLRELKPELPIIFLTGYSEHALEAFSVHASGYLLKPVEPEQLQKEVDYALRGMIAESAKGGDPDRIVVQTFGVFEVFVDGTMVDFSRSKAKEVLAYLVDRQGAFVTREMIFETLWSDEAEYDRSMQKYLDVIITSMRKTLEDYGIGDMIERVRGRLRVRPEIFSCDLYQFIAGDIHAVYSYHGEYMRAYPWANMTEAYVDRKSGRI